jgi:demethylmenaquinone methyltransferase / 2-methoxy-6-polyprenyl-1,4-benzoquinol methylase
MSAPVLLQPHPILRPYYSSESHKLGFLRGIFDGGAADYDAVEKLLSLGSGRRYRREALARAGLVAGMSVLDVAVGTGLVAREAIALAGNLDLVLGLDPSMGMIAQAVRALGIRAVLAVAERIPLPAGQFDFLSMGYALRHLSDVHRAFGEFYRVLKPGGRICLLEITAPSGWLARGFLRIHMRSIVPLLTRIATARAQSQTLWRYYWDTIEACLPPEVLLAAICRAGFVDARRHVSFGIFSEYTASKPS